MSDPTTTSTGTTQANPAPAPAPAAAPASTGQPLNGATGANGANGAPSPSTSTHPTVDPAPADIVSRASKFKSSQSNGTPSTSDPSQLSADFDRGKYEALLAQAKQTNPELAAQLEALPKSWQAAYTRKVQELQSQSNQPWTPERIQKLINDPQFLAAAQQVYGPQGQSGEDESLLSDEERQLKQQLMTVQQQLDAMQANQLDSQLTTRYANYDPSRVSQLQQGLITGQVRATREHLWKALDYDDAVTRAYQMGMEDAKGGITRAHQAASTNGHSITTEYTPPARGEKESRVSHLSRMIAERMKQRAGSEVRL